MLTDAARPDAGTVLVTGLDVVRDAVELRSRIGLAGQYAAVDENLTGIENLVMVGASRRAPRSGQRRAEELLERFDLAQAAKRPVKTYSGGMRRRLDLAAALVAPAGALPRRADDRPRPAAAWRCWRRSRAWSPRARPSCSPPSTSMRPTAGRPDRVIDRGTSSPRDARRLKERVGGERLEVDLADAVMVDAAVCALAPMSDEPPTTDEETVRLSVRQRTGTIVEACAASTRSTSP